MAKSQGAGKNTVNNKIQVLEDAKQELQPPKGFELETEEQHNIWLLYSEARALKDWTEPHKVMLYNMVMVQDSLNAEMKLLAEEETVVMTEKGTPVPNPRLRVTADLNRLLITQVRALSMQVTESETKTIKESARTAKDAKDTVRKVGKLSLLA